MAVHGVDVSNHQPSWRPASNDRFVFILASDGHSWETPKNSGGVTVHDQQVAIVRKANRVVGHYHWLRHGNIAAQAAWFVKCAKPRPGDVLAIDWEQSGTTNRDKDDMIKAVQALCPGNRVVKYANLNFLHTYDKTGFSGDGLWLAEPDASKPGVSCLFWQYKFGTTGPDLDRAYFPSVAALKAWAAKKPTPIPAPTTAPSPAQPAIVTTLKGTPLDLSSLPTGKGPRFKFRDRLTNTSGAYPGAVCDCIPKHIALVEALAKEVGLSVPLQFWEGCFIITPNSGQTHAGGGAYDIKITGLTTKQVTALTKVERQAGAAAWYRGPGTKFGNFSTAHIHVELIGCSHASSAASAQWADYKNGRNGLADHAADYGPKTAYITASNAYKNLTRAGTPADSKDWLDMATQKEVQAAFHAELDKYFGDLFPSPSLNPASVKSNPKWAFTSTIGWLTKLVSLIRRDMPTKKQIDDLTAAVKALKEGK